MPNICPVSNLLFIVAYYGMIFAEEVFGSCAASVVATFSFFKTDILFAFAMVNVGAILVRTRSLLMDRWEMGFWERRNMRAVTKDVSKSSRASFANSLLVVAYCSVCLLLTLTFVYFLDTVACVITVVFATNWTDTVLVVAIVFLIMLALVLYGGVFFRVALDRLRGKKVTVTMV